MYFFPLVVFKDLKERGVPADKLVRAYELYSEEMIKLHFGQGLDIWWHRGNKNPSADEYLQMYVLAYPFHIGVSNKTTPQVRLQDGNTRKTFC